MSKADKRSGVDMAKELVSVLHKLSEDASNLASNLGAIGRRMDRRERSIASLAVNMIVGDLMDEAKYSALNDDLQCFETAVELVKDWVEFKRDF